MTAITNVTHLPDPFLTQFSHVVREFENIVATYGKKPHHIQRLIKLLGKKLHVKFCTSQRVALTTLIEIANNPKSREFAGLIPLLGLKDVKRDGVESAVNTLAVVITCLNMQHMQVGIFRAGKFKNYSQPYLAKIAGCSSKTIYRHLKVFATAGVMRQQSKHVKVAEGIYSYRASMKIVFNRMFHILGVSKDQLNADRDHFAMKSARAHEMKLAKERIEKERNAQQSKPQGLQEINPVEETLVTSDDRFKSDRDLIAQFTDQAITEMKAYLDVDMTNINHIQMVNQRAEFLLTQYKKR